MFRPREDARPAPRPMASGVRRPHPARAHTESLPRNFRPPVAPRLPAIPSFDDLDLDSTADTQGATKRLSEAVDQLAVQVGKQSVQLTQLNERIEVLTQTVDKGFQDLNRKMEGWINRLQEVIEQDSGTKTAENFLGGEFLDFQ